MTRNLYPNVIRRGYIVVTRDMTIMNEEISVTYHEGMIILIFDTLKIKLFSL